VSGLPGTAMTRLPHPIHEEINRRLQNGEKSQDIIQWLNIEQPGASGN
jgi:hypothetical protein